MSEAHVKIEEQVPWIELHTPRTGDKIWVTVETMLSNFYQKHQLHMSTTNDRYLVANGDPIEKDATSSCGIVNITLAIRIMWSTS